MFGAVCGDIIGSYYERHSTKQYDFQLLHRSSTFTDDSIMTAAVCDAILFRPAPIKLYELQSRAKEYALRYKAYYARYPHSGFGHKFKKWARSDTLYVQNSFGNGGAMRVIPIGYAYDTLQQIELQAYASCLYTHAHPEAVQGAKAVASAVFLARTGHSREEIRTYLEKHFHYNLSKAWRTVKASHSFSCRTIDSVPPAIQAFLESTDFEDCIRRAVSLGGDADTMACIAGGIAQAFYGEIPPHILKPCRSRTDKTLRNLFDAFQTAFPASN